MTTRFARLAVAVTVLHASAALAQPEKTLDKCQQTAGKETGKYAAAVQKNAGKCLNKISKLRIKEAGDASEAAKSCASAFRKLVNTEDATKTLAAKSTVKIAKICDPAALDSKAEHTAADVLGAGATVAGDAIEADDLGGWCTHFGGGGTVTSVSDWISCQLAAASCQAQQQLAAEYPNALTWLDEVTSDIQALGGDPKYTDAVQAIEDLEGALDSNEDGIFDLVCGPRGLTATGQSASLKTGDDGDIQAGAELRYVDNGNGTITDLNTGLMWEKLCDEDPPGATCSADHDVDTTYNWDNAFDVKIANLNGATFAGYDDWRVPNVKELHSIIDFDVISPAVDAAFNNACVAPCSETACSCTASDFYWSSTSVATDPTVAWRVFFDFGIVNGFGKTGTFRVRAVRGGL